MNCRDFEDRIQELLDQRVDLLEDFVVQNHAKQCEPCSQKLFWYGQLFNSDSSLSDSFCLVRSERLVPESRSTARIRNLAGVLAVCVSLAIVVWVSFVVSDQTSHQIAHARTDTREPQRSIDATTEVPQHHLGFDIPNYELPSLVYPSGFEASSIPRMHRAPTNDLDGKEVAIRENRNDLDANFFSKPVDAELTVTHLSRLVTSIDQIPLPLSALQSYYDYTSAIPGVRPWTSGLNHAARLIQRTIEEKPGTRKSETDDLGHRPKFPIDCLNGLWA